MADAWQPLLCGSMADDAIQTARDISDAIDERIRARGATSWELASHALLACYVSLACDDHAARARAERSIAAAAAELADDEAPSTNLLGGVVGVAWVVRHVERLLGDSWLDLSDLDAAIDELDVTRWTARTGLADGLAGLGVYVLEREHRSMGRLRSIVARLSELAEQRPDGVTWCTDASVCNLGMLHGVPGTVAFLCRAATEGASDVASSLARAATSWLLGRRFATGSPVFPFVEIYGRAGMPADTGWGYGDAPIALAVDAAAAIWNEGAWAQAALDIAVRGARRGPQAWACKNAGLGHGLAGNAHAFHRMYRRTNLDELAAASTAWYRALLDARTRGAGIAGYRSFFPDRGGWLDDVGFVSGAAGIALSLLAGSTHVPPGWDRLLGCS